jgi:hypothetical protein
MLLSWTTIYRYTSRVVKIASTLVWLSCGDCVHTPSLTSISPTNLSAGGPGLLLTINGNNFQQNSTVNWNGAVRPTTFGSSHQLIAAISASDVAVPGPVKISVLSPPEVSPITFTTASGSSGGASPHVDCAGGSSNIINMTISP